MATEFDCLHSVLGRVGSGGAANKPRTLFSRLFGSVMSKALTKIFQMYYRIEQRIHVLIFLRAKVLTMEEETLK